MSDSVFQRSGEEGKGRLAFDDSLLRSLRVKKTFHLGPSTSVPVLLDRASNAGFQRTARRPGTEEGSTFSTELVKKEREGSKSR